MPTIKMFRDRVVLILAACVAIAGAAQAQTQPTASIIAKFSGTNGSNPASQLIQLPSGNLFGLTLSAAYYPKIPSTLFQILHTGAIQTVYVLAADGSQGAMDGGYFANNGLFQASDGNIYGLTYSSRDETGAGLAFRFSFPNTFEVLYNFAKTPSSYTTAAGSLVQASDGNLYGVAGGGGQFGFGGIFRIGLDGSYLPVHDFSHAADDIIGGAPYLGLVAHSNGLLYGSTSTAELGGVDNFGSIFSFDPSTGTVSYLATNPTSLDGITVGSDGGIHVIAGSAACVNCSGAILRYGTDGSGPQTEFVFPNEPNFQFFYGLTELAPGVFFVAEPPLLANTQTAALTQVTLPSHLFGGVLGNFTETAGGALVAAFPQTTPSPFFGAVASINGGFPKPAPVITAVFPTTVAPGQLVTTLGSYFVGATAVTLGGHSVSFTVKASGAITFPAPASGISGAVSITTPGGSATGGQVTVK